MKRTLTKVVYTSLLQANKTAYDFNDVDPAENLLYGLLTYQGLKPSNVGR